jgi:16S rRNA (guanine527-N7)-methyltransferase
LDKEPPSLPFQELLQQGAGDIGLLLAVDQTRAFSLYAEELLRWNRKMNLTGAQEAMEIAVNHFLGSLAFTLGFPQDVPQKLVDVGSGAGFPGLPIKIACPALQVTLVESSRKKTSFLGHICRLLHLERIECIRARAEELAGDPAYRESFDVCVARAVGKTHFLVEISEGLLRPGGRLISSGREQAEGPVPGGGSLIFQENRRVRFTSLGLERRLLIWEKKGRPGPGSTHPPSHLRRS